MTSHTHTHAGGGGGGMSGVSLHKFKVQRNQIKCKERNVTKATNGKKKKKTKHSLGLVNTAGTRCARMEAGSRGQQGAAGGGRGRQGAAGYPDVLVQF